MKRSALAIFSILPALAFPLFAGPAWNNQLGPWATGFGCVEALLWLLAAVVAVAVLAAVGGRRAKAWSFAVMLVAFQTACVIAAWPFAAGKMAQGIDHPAFMFRLHEFFTAFPALGSYNPYWNGGTEHFIGVTSGAHNFGFLMAPFLLFMPLETAYSSALLFWMVIGFPWLTVAAFRRAGMRLEGALTGGLVMLAFDRAEYLFFWQSGNLGGMVAAMLAPVVVALSYCIAVQRRGTSVDVAALAIAAWLSCIWTPGVFTCGGIFLSWIWLRKRWTRKSVVQMLIAGGVAALLLSPWIWTTLFPARGIADYVATSSAPGETVPRMLLSGLSQFGKRALEWHPVILVLGVPAAFFALGGNIRKWTIPVFAVLFAITVSIGFKRTSQLDRVAIQMSCAMLFPAAIAAGRVFARVHRGGLKTPVWALSAAVIVSVLAVGGRVAVLHFGNSAGFKLWPAQEPVYSFADWIHDNVPPGGRFAFAGITDCKFEWGKPTYLPILSGREMMSDDYYGYPKGLTERNYPPKFYRRSDELFARFSDAYGITHWAVTDSRNKAFFDANTNLFELVDYRMQQSTHIYTYKRIGVPEPTRCLQGSAKVTARENRLEIEPADPNEEIVLRYNWRPGLVCKTPGATIRPYSVDENLRFISVLPNGNEKIILGHRPTWHPLAPNFDGTFHH